VKEYVVELSQVDSFADAIAAFNEGLIERCGGHWNGNLDAFNDYLSWPVAESYRLVLRGAAQGRHALGHAAMAQWAREHIGTCHPSNVESMRDRVIVAEGGEGPTLFDELMEIIAHNGHVTLVEE
jgi:hypothetical protein